ncbi:MAG: hypothetical protein NT053_13250 [Cyanobacteria bacterium]|jgi:hypothetical protein|nr:hypothetical protein [Cyanobacteriota bacterium]
MFDTSSRITRRRSSAGPIPPQRPQQPRPRLRDISGPRESGVGGQRPTFLTLRDHGKVYVADLPRLSDGQLSQIAREAEEVFESLNRRLEELRNQLTLSQVDQDTRIRATTKRDVTERFLASIAQEQELRRSNPALRAAAGESLARAFLELARHRLPGATFDSLLEEALSACDPTDPEGRSPSSHDPQVIRLLQGNTLPTVRAEAMPVVLTPDLPRDSAV